MHRTLKYTTLLAGLLVVCAPAIAEPPEQPIFWSIENARGPAGYLLGTIHSEDPRVLEFSVEFLQALASCEVFAMELVPDLPNLARLQEVMQLPPEESLSGLLGAARFESVAAALAELGLSAPQAERLKPWAAMISLSIPRPRTGQFLDYALSLRAMGHGLQVAGLETVDQQLAFLEQLDHERQIELLDHALAEFAQVEAVHTRMVDTYLRGDLALLWAQAEEEMRPLRPETRRYFLEQGIAARNAGMLNTALPMLDQGRVFIAVGALHLAGERGLVQLLRQSGYTLTPLPLPFQATAEVEPQSTRRQRAATAMVTAAASSTAPQTGSTHTTAMPGTAQPRLAASRSIRG